LEQLGAQEPLESRVRMPVVILEARICRSLQPQQQHAQRTPLTAIAAAGLQGPVHLAAGTVGIAMGIQGQLRRVPQEVARDPAAQCGSSRLAAKPVEPVVPLLLVLVVQLVLPPVVPAAGAAPAPAQATPVPAAGAPTPAGAEAPEGAEAAAEAAEGAPPQCGLQGQGEHHHRQHRLRLIAARPGLIHTTPNGTPLHK
jgi:hypothetical protein